MRVRSATLFVLVSFGPSAAVAVSCVNSSDTNGGPDASYDTSVPSFDAPSSPDVPRSPTTDAGPDTSPPAPDASTSDAPADAADAADSADAAPDAQEAGLTTGLVVSAPANNWPVGVAVVGNEVFVLSTNTPQANTGTLTKCTPTAGDCGAPTALLQNLANNTQLSTDGTTLFFAMRGSSGMQINSCPAANCNNTTTKNGADGWTDMSGVAADSNNAYYAAGVSAGQYRIYSLPKALSSETMIAQSLPQTANLASDGTNLYIGYSAGGIYTCNPSVSCASPTLLQPTASTSGIAIDGTYIYWADPVNAAINRCPIAGCGDATAPTPIVPDVPGHPNGIAVYGQYLLYTVGSAVGAPANGVYAALR